MRNMRSGLLGGIFGLFVASLAACGGRDAAPELPPEPEVQAGEVVSRSRASQVAVERRDRQRQQYVSEQGDAPFAYIRYAPDLTQAQPRACLVFSRPLDPDIDYAVFVPVRGNSEPAYSVEGRDLCLDGLSFASTYTATLREGLPALDGSRLGREEEVSLSFEDRPAYVGFRGAGVILPREDADGLAVETVNVDQVRIRVARVNDRALVFKSVTQGETTPEGRYGYLYGGENPDDVAAEVWSGTMGIDSVRNAPVTTIFPLPDVIGSLAPGAYFVSLEDAKPISRRDGPAASARRWILLTDLALTAYRSDSGLDVSLRSLQDGKVMPNTRIRLIARNNEILGESTTGVNGKVQFNAELLAGTGPMAPKLVLASGLKGDTAMLDLERAPVDLSAFATGGRATPHEVDGFVYTERGIYRPGETVHLTAMLRDRTGRAVADRTGTLVTFRPNGVEAQRSRFTIGMAGSLQRDLDLPATASRGTWRTEVRLDGLGRVGDVSYSVEDFVPQRIAVELGAEDTALTDPQGSRLIDVSSRFLYGAPGAGLTVQTQVRLEPDPSPFPGYDGFRWGRHDQNFRQEMITPEPRTTDGLGQTTVRIRPQGRGQSADRPLRLNTVVSVLEPGGRAVSESLRLAYRPASLYVGTRAAFEGRVEAGGTAAFDLAVVDAGGVGRTEELSWKLLAIDYHYDWYREDGRWRWRRSRTVRTVNEGALGTDDGSARLEISGLEWGEHELHVRHGDGAAASRRFYVGWGGAESAEGVEAPDRVQVLVDEQNVVPGRPAALTIVPPYDGEAQIVVATDSMLTTETRPVRVEGTEVILPVTDDWGEGAYVMVTVFTPRDPIVQAKPRRAVGVGYVPVDMADRTFSVAIEAPELVRPGQSQTVRVDVDGGPREKAFVTLAAVDEGILRLTKFDSPDPVDWYFGRKALGVSLYDDYGRLLDPNLGLPAEVRSGGDQLGGEGLTVVPTQTVALFSGVVEVGRNNAAEITFDLPEFNGEVRLMAVAWSASGLGAASQAMTIRDRAPADLILPRFLAPGDTAVATVSVDNVELGEGTFRTRLDSTRPVTVATAELGARLAPGQRLDEGFRISSDGAGVARLRLSVDGPENYSVDRTYPIQSRSAFLPVTTYDQTLMEAGQTFVPGENLLDGFVADTATISVSFSGLPVDSGALYASLSSYPYGCTEQTVSRALPLLYADRLNLAGGDGAAEAEHVSSVQTAVGDLLNRQGAGGAFGLWREGDRNASPWLGAYTTDFLYRAREAGYEVPLSALDRAYGALRDVAEGEAWRVYGYDTEVYESRWHSDTRTRLMQRSSAYALYVLARAGRADISRLRYLHDRDLQAIRSPLARAHLGAGLALMGDRARAQSAFDAAEQALGYRNSGDYYQTELRDLAGVIALAAETGFNDHVARLSERLAEDSPEPEQLTTQEKAFLLLAVSGLDTGEQGRLDIDGDRRFDERARRFTLTAADLDRGVSFRVRRGSAPLFRSVMVRGAPDRAPPAASRALTIEKTLRDLRGRPVDLADIRQGDQLVVSLTLTPRQRRNNPVIIADLLPAGFEIEAVLRPSDGAVAGGEDGAYAWVGTLNRAKTAEARDDRFVAAIDLVDRPQRLAYLVRAVTPGRFVLPGVVAEDMYRPDVFARSSSGMVEISATGLGAGGAP